MANYRIVWIAGVVFVLAGSTLSAQEKASAAEGMERGMAHGMPRAATPGANSAANQQMSPLAPPQDATQSSAGATPSSEPAKPVEVPTLTRISVWTRWRPARRPNSRMSANSWYFVTFNSRIG